MSDHEQHAHGRGEGRGSPGRHHCVNDGSLLTIREIEGRPLEACDRCGFVLWRDPKVATATVVLDGQGNLVLGRRATEPGYGEWCLPGGFLNGDEPPAEGAARECREEVGATVEIQALIGAYHVPPRTGAGLVVLAYAGRLAPDGAPAPGPEMLEAAAFPLDQLPELAFSTHREALTDWLAGRR